MSDVELLNEFFHACELYNGFCNNVASYQLVECGSIESFASDLIPQVEVAIQNAHLHHEYSPVTLTKLPQEVWSDLSVETAPIGKALKQYLFMYDTSVRTHETDVMNFEFRASSVVQNVIARLSKIFCDSVHSVWELKVNQEENFYDIMYEDFVFLLEDNRVYLLHLGISD
jgi:hypothetical protein